MSKIVLAIVLICTVLPFIIFLCFGNTEPEPVPLPMPTEEVKLNEEQKPVEARSDDSPQCALCRQITDTTSQNQCFTDFACSL